MNSNKKFNDDCVKSVQIRSYFWSVFACIQSEYRKIRTKNDSVFGHFSGSVSLTKYLIYNEVILVILSNDVCVHVFIVIM